MSPSLSKPFYYLKNSNISLGDKNQEYANHYETTNNRLLPERESPIMQKYFNINLKTSIDLKEDKDTNYMTENKHKYGFINIAILVRIVI